MRLNTGAVALTTPDLMLEATPEQPLTTGLHLLRNSNNILRMGLDLATALTHSPRSQVLIDTKPRILHLKEALTIDRGHMILTTMVLHFKEALTINRGHMVLPTMVLLRKSYTRSSTPAVGQDRWRCPLWEVSRLVLFSVVCLRFSGTTLGHLVWISILLR